VDRLVLGKAVPVALELVLVMQIGLTRLARMRNVILEQGYLSRAEMLEREWEEGSG
jgi:hypothetical protein